MSASSVLVRVNALRSSTGGGAIFVGVEVDANGGRIDAKQHLVVRVARWMIQTPVEPGQVWRVIGTSEQNTIIVNGYKLTESTLTAEHMELMRPSGEHIVTLLAQGKVFTGIGVVKARRLWGHFGEDLYKILDHGLTARLEEVLSFEAAQRLAQEWRVWGDSFTVQWLQSKGIPVNLGKKVLDFFSPNAAQRIEEDPYRLVSFAADWPTTDRMARETFGIKEDDPRRLAGAVEEALYAAFDAGHTWVTQTELHARLDRLLGLGSAFGAQGKAEVWERCLRQAQDSGCLVRTEIKGSRGVRLHASGPYLMESAVAQAIGKRCAHKQPLLDPASLDAVVQRHQTQTGLRLEPSQKQAIELANDYAFAVITGEAGTGKTTVLRGIFAVYQEAGWQIYPMALSGRAARRIGEATGEAASTIAGFLVKFDPADAPQRGVVVIDEASMLDLPSTYRLLRHLPPSWRFVLVGDPNQLPPVGPGLLLHELARGESKAVPRVQLQKVQRYGGDIAIAASHILRGQWPQLPSDESCGIAAIECPLPQLNATVLELLRQDPLNTQILSATRAAVHGGVTAINALCLTALHGQNEELIRWNAEYGCLQSLGLRVGSPVICLVNDWEKNLQNGSLGFVVSANKPVVGEDSRVCYGHVRWDDGITREITAERLPDLELAYAVTVHKSQGSQFKRVIIPVRRSRLLDRDLLYTAITRAQTQVILVGDMAAAKYSVEAPPHASLRQVALGSMLTEVLAGMA
ncbi:MAG: exonuclease V subunit alpha [Acidiphilium sp. 37-60-79]|nr:MAG: exonuclease V subunit alpha [Acidiphilium sp. 37-60-79]